MEKWVVHNKKADFFGLAKKYSVDPVVIRLLTNRGVTEEKMEEFFRGTLDGLNDPYLLKDVEKAARVTKTALESGEPIRIIGDYDIDGINSCYILYCGLSMLGANVDYRIPDRMRDGYGLNERLVREAYDDGRRMLITCDNGIAAAKEIALAKELGMRVVVTDHHEVPFDLVNGQKQYRLPPADAVVDPKQADCTYPFEGICGAVVAWKFLMVLFEVMGHSRSETDIFLENAAFATVCDVMPLVEENHIIVREGLRAMQQTKNLGLRMLLMQNELDRKELSVYHMGFVIGPCFNAGGRLDSAMRCMELLLEKDPAKALVQAQELTDLNRQRKTMTEQGVDDAIAQIEGAVWKDAHVYCIYLPTCHESIAGIIAGRIREKYARPVFVICGEEEQVKGSGRSIEAYSMFEEMNRVKDVFLKFGGHPLAAGFSLEKSRIDEMRSRLNELETLREEDLVDKTMIDMVMPIDYPTMQLVKEINAMEPFGNAFERPLFAERDAVIASLRMVGSKKNTLKIRFEKDGRAFDGIYFCEAEKELEFLRSKYGAEELEAALHGRGQIRQPFSYTPEINAYMGRESLQIKVKSFYHG